MTLDPHHNKCTKPNTMELEQEEFMEDDSSNININDLPDEVLEYIFSFVSPYKDLKECMLVCKRWHENVKNVVRLLSLKLTNAINSMDVAWQSITPVEMARTITKRYSHSACYHENYMYVFGGCTSTSTTFNDLWRLDLNKRQWVRQLTIGTYPSPKACASMVLYKDDLVVFGGWTLPSPYPLHQPWTLFNELHIYSIVKNRWMCINTPFSPPGMAGHSASVHGDVMVVFGGLKSEPHGNHASSNDVWCFDLDSQEWHRQATSAVRPHARYGQSQIWLGDQHLLIMGGCGGPNMIYNDVWLLSLTGKEWKWREVNVQNREWSPTYMWCHRACRIGNLVVMLSRDPRPLTRRQSYTAKSKPRPRSSSSVWIPPSYEESLPNIPRCSNPVVHVDKDPNVNGQRGTFTRVSGAFQQMECEPGPSGVNKHSDLKNREPEPQPGPSGVSKYAAPGQSSLSSNVPSNSSNDPSCSFNSVKNSPGRSDDQDSQGSSPPSPNVHNWDRLRPINRLSSDEKRMGNIQLAAFQQQDQAARTCPNRARERQLQALQRFEERMRFNNQARAQEPSNSNEASSVKLQRTMVVCVMDISNVLNEECSVRWLALSPDTYSGGPEETILYTLVAGRGELIMFGGIHREALSLMTNSQPNSASNVSNSLHFISAPYGVI